MERYKKQNKMLLINFNRKNVELHWAKTDDKMFLKKNEVEKKKWLKEKGILTKGRMKSPKDKKKLDKNTK